MDGRLGGWRLGRRARRLRWSSSFLTLLWAALCWSYIGSQVGWPVLTQLMPHEIGLVVTGVLAPLALLWAMTLAETRSDIMAAELSRQVALLLDTPTAALRSAETGADTLQQRARALAQSGRDAAQELEAAALRIERAVEQAARLRSELALSVQLLSEQVDRAAGLAQLSESQLAEWRAIFDQLPPVPQPGRWARLQSMLQPAAGWFKADRG